MNNENIFTPTHLSQPTTAIWMSANCDKRNHALDLENSVVCGNAVEQNCGNAVEQAMRGNSGCESKCRFPNTGGLHRTSGDAPLETHPERAHEHENSVVCGNAVEQNQGNAVEQAKRGKSGCESKCSIPNTGGLYRTSGDAPLETHPERAHEHENSVVCGNAVERNRDNAIEQATRGKSRCESKCHFPNTGGLHRTSGDAPLETHPPFSYVQNSNSPSSKRTQAASSAFRVNQNESARHSTKHRGY
jgi:hypothetical protein